MLYRFIFVHTHADPILGGKTAESVQSQRMVTFNTMLEGNFKHFFINCKLPESNPPGDLLAAAGNPVPEARRKLICNTFNQVTANLYDNILRLFNTCKLVCL